MLTFVRNESFRAEAEAGAHDDLVMALGIAHFIRPYQSYLVNEERDDVEWSDAMREDYRRADENTKRLLRQKWGTPPKKRGRK